MSSVAPKSVTFTETTSTSPAGRKVVTLRLTGDPEHRPATFSSPSLELFEQHLTRLGLAAHAGEIDGLILTGNTAAFVAGADLTELAGTESVAAGRAVGKLGQEVFHLVHLFPVPVVAALSGPAIGGGLELALHAHGRVAADSVKLLGLPEVRLGVVPGWGGTYMLPRVIGVPGAIDLIVTRPLSGHPYIPAQLAAKIGLVDDVVSEEELLSAALTLVDELHPKLSEIQNRQQAKLELSADDQQALDEMSAVLRQRYELPGGNWSRQSPKWVHDLLLASPATERYEHLANEAEALAELLVGPEIRTSVYSAGLAKPVRPVPAKYQRVGVVGAGLMASQLAVQFALHGQAQVVMRDLDESRVAGGLQNVADQLAQAAKRDQITPAQAAAAQERVTGTTELSAFSDTDLVIEAVTELLAVKRQVFAELETVVRPDTVLATNTSALSVAAMANGLQHPGRVLGLHFFNPVSRLPLVEVVRTPLTTDEVAEFGLHVVESLGKRGVLVADRPGFVVNRILLRMLAEVVDSVEQGASVELADASLRQLGLPLGPFALIDLIGIQVTLQVLDTLRADLGPRFPDSPGLRLLASEGGKLAVPGLGGPTVDPAVASAFGQFPGAPGSPHWTAETILAGVLRAVAEEIDLILSEGVAANYEEIDTCLLLGAWWPWHLGGITPFLHRAGYLPTS